MALTIDQFDARNIIFDDVKKYSFGGIYYQRIPIKYVHEGKPIELCIATTELTSYGVQENRQRTAGSGGNSKYSKSMTEKPVQSYSLPIIMSDPAMVDVIESIVKECQNHLRDNNIKNALRKYNILRKV